MARYTYSTNDSTDFGYAFNGLNFLLSLWDLDQWLREQVKYNAEGHTEEAIVAFDKVRDKLREVMEEHDVNLDMLS
jgi:hypothetical protein